MANLFFVKKIVGELTENPVVILGSVFLTAFYFSLNNWTLQGMEVGVVTMLLSAALWLSIRASRGERFTVIPYLLLGLGTWIRMDVVVPYLALFMYQLIFDPKNRREHLYWGGGLFLGFLVIQTGARLLYYGELLPNTYYLKMQGYGLFTRLKRGLTVYAQFAWNMNWLIFLIPFTVLLLRPDRNTGLLLFIFLAQSAYSIYVGGDAWEHKGGANRFISSGMPAFFVLFTLALDQIRFALVKVSAFKVDWLPRALNLALVPIIIASLFSFNTLLEQDSVRKWTLIKRPIFVAGNEKHTRMGLLVRDLTGPEASIAVVSAGAISYFSDRISIDLLGKADKVIANSEPRNIRGISDDEDFRPGHNKWDYAYSIGELKPDLVVQLWSHPDEADPYLGDYVEIKVDEFSMLFLKDLPNIRWDLLP